MTKINYFLICQDVLGNENEQIIRNPYMVLQPLSIPGNFSFTVSLGLYDLESSKNYRLKIELISPDNTSKEIRDISFTAPTIELDQQPDAIGIGNLNLAFPNFEFYHKGVYKFKLSISTTELIDEKEIEILVKEKTRIH